MSEFKPMTSNTGTLTTVPSAATSTTILAANARRKGACIVNTDANALCLNLAGGTATTTTAFNVRLIQNAYFEIPFGYTGLITGIWETDGAGAANVCEFI